MKRVLLAAGLALAVAAPAQAQPTAEARAEAQARFDRGLTLYDEGQHDAALAEFQEAYALWPRYQILFNLGLVHAERGQAVEAVDYFERFLREGGDRLSPARREVAEARLAEQRARIARVMIRVDVEGATITVDGDDVAEAPLAAPLRISAGEHAIAVSAPRYATARRTVRLAGDVDVALDFELERAVEERGSLRIRSILEGVAVTVDGAAVGETPLDGTIGAEPGAHVLTGARRGYLPRRADVVVALGAETEVRLDLEVDPDAAEEDLGRIQVALPEAEVLVRVDGRRELLSDGALELPVGPHRLELSVEERRPFRARIEVQSGRTEELRPRLRWADDARRDRLAEAEGRRIWGAIVGLAGVATVITSVILRVVVQPRLDEEAELKAAHDACVGTGMLCSDWDDSMEPRLEDLQTFNPLVEIGSYLGMAVGVGAAAVGAWLFFGAPDEPEIDAGAGARADPRVQIGVGWGTITARGAF